VTDRLPPLDPARFSPEQKHLHDAIAGVRGGAVRGPFAVWLRTPAIAEAANRFGNAIRLDGKLDKKLFELAILAVARHWGAQYEWFVHERHALDAGLARDIVEAIRDRRVPVFADDAQRLVYEVVNELQQTRTLGDASYQRAVAALGEELLIELITTVGFYTVAAMMINAFAAPVPGGARPLP
jgi:4-carboxymuconolactone decarboxylase